MNNPDCQQESDPRLFIRPHILNRILRWLTDLIQLTEDEQEDAGIYLDYQPCK
ncbi:MAG: hypothetical protein IPN96_06200 [Anaerolineales bacterium]|nr:hypothetical protein [Anaerolineales bacterium]MBK8822926.1 hypothetical protein [Anaerolineales bacterium]